MAGVVATVAAGRTVRLTDGRTFAPTKTFTVYSGAELPVPPGASDVEMSQEITDLKTAGYITSAALPVQIPGAAASSLDKDPYLQEVRSRQDLNVIALGCYTVGGHREPAQGASVTVKMCFEIPFDGFLVRYAACAQTVTGAPVMALEHAGGAVAPASAPFVSSGVPVGVDLTVPKPVVKGDKIEFLLTTAVAEDLVDVGVVASLLCKQVLHQTVPADAVVALDTEASGGPVVRGAKTFNPIP